MNAPLTAWIEGIGFLAPGLPDWPTARAVLRGEAPLTAAPSILPAPSLLPPAERRRASRVVKLTLAVGLEAANHAGADVATLATVFSASGADGHNCHALCEQLATDDRQISPTRFHNSVHNAAAGYWGIATHAMAPCQVLCAFDASFGAGLLEAAVQCQATQAPVLLVACDVPYPQPLHALRAVADSLALALVIAPPGGGRGLSLAVTVDAPATPCADAGLEDLRDTIPAARALPLLQALAGDAAATLVLEGLPGMALRIEVAAR